MMDLESQPTSPDEARADMIIGIMEGAASSRKAHRFPPDAEFHAIVPDWMYPTLTQRDRQDLLAFHHIRVVKHSEFYTGEEGL